MEELSNVLSWQFSLGFVVGVLTGGLLVLRAFALTAQEIKQNRERNCG